jgi:putative transposase
MGIIFKNRKLNRLKDFDYSLSNAYFVTICTKNKITCLGNIVRDIFIPNQYGKIVVEQWIFLEEKYQYVILDEYSLMPDHFHGIICIDSSVIKTLRTGHDLSLPGKSKIKPLSELIGVFKTTSSKAIHLSGMKEFSWQRSFYDRIIQNKQELHNIRKYIYYNPSKWAQEKEIIENVDSHLLDE